MKQIHYIEIGGAYQLTREYVTETTIKPEQRIYFRFTILETDGTLRLKKGFAWDGASGAIDFDTILRGSCVHDAIYELIRQELLPSECKDIADEELREDCLIDGMNSIKAKIVYEAVEHLADAAVDPENKRVEKVAP